MRRSSWMRSTRAAWSPIFSASATSPRRDALGKGRPCHCHFPAVHELSARDSASSRSQKATWKTQIAVIWKKGGNSLRFCRTLSMPAWRAYYNEEVRRRSLFSGISAADFLFYFSFFLLHKQQRDIQQCHNHRNRKQGNFQPQTVRVFFP